jgi:hypothetical protein
MTIRMAGSLEPDPQAPWRGLLDGPVTASAVEGGKAFILAAVSSRRRIPKQALALAFARFGNKPTWEVVLPQLIRTGAIDLVVESKTRHVLIVQGPGRPPDPMEAGPDPFGYHGEAWA